MCIYRLITSQYIYALISIEVFFRVCSLYIYIYIYIYIYTFGKYFYI